MSVTANPNALGGVIEQHGEDVAREQLLEAFETPDQETPQRKASATYTSPCVRTVGP